MVELEATATTGAINLRRQKISLQPEEHRCPGSEASPAAVAAIWLA